MKITLTVLVLFLTLFGYSQNYMPTQKQSSQKPSIYSLYAVEFELKNYVFINEDSTILNSINLEDYSSLRDGALDLEFYHAGIDQTLVLYSFQRMEANYTRRGIVASENDN